MPAYSVNRVTEYVIVPVNNVFVTYVIIVHEDEPLTLEVEAGTAQGNTCTMDEG